MYVLTLATQKGGSGKSVLARSLAVAAQAAGKKVAVLDTDPQATVYKWSARREAETPVVDRCEPHQLDAVLRAMPREGFDLVIIDTAGAHNAAVAPAIAGADFCLVPVKPTLDDLEAVLPTAKALKDRKKRFGFVLSQCAGSQARLNDAAAALLEHGEVAPANIHNRVDYPDAASSGLGVTEFNPNGAAAKEIKLLWAWLSRTLENPA